MNLHQCRRLGEERHRSNRHAYSAEAVIMVTVDRDVETWA